MATGSFTGCPTSARRNSRPTCDASRTVSERIPCSNATWCAFGAAEDRSPRRFPATVDSSVTASMENKKPFKTLILCTGNSARSIIGEYLLRAKGMGRFDSYSAGTHPTGTVNPLALWVLQDLYGIDASGARSKSWEEFKDVNFDFVITVCDRAKESCPVWPGQPITAHWGFEDPAAATGTDEQKARIFRKVYTEIQRRIDLFLALPMDKLSHFELEKQVRGIGQSGVARPEGVNQ